MSKTKVLCVKIPDLDFVFGSVLTDMFIFGTLIFVIGEHIKFRIANIPVLNIFFSIVAICFFLNFYRIIYLYQSRTFHGFLDKTLVILRIFLFFFAFYLIYFIEIINSEEAAWFGKKFWTQILIIVCAIMYGGLTIIYKNIIWETKSQRRILINEYQRNDFSNKASQEDKKTFGPKTYGKIRVHEYEKIEERNSFLKHYEQTMKKNKNEPKVEKRTENSTLTKKDPLKEPLYQDKSNQNLTKKQFDDKNAKVNPRDTVNNTIDKNKIIKTQLPVKEEFKKTQIPVKEEKKNTQTFGKVRVLEEQDVFDESDSWIKKYERDVIGKNKTNAQKRKPINEPIKNQPSYRQSFQQNRKQPFEENVNKMDSIEETHLSIESSQLPQRRTEPVMNNREIRQDQINIDQEKDQFLYSNEGEFHITEDGKRVRGPRANIHGKVRVLEEHEIFKEDESFIKRYEKAQKKKDLEQKNEIEIKKRNEIAFISTEKETNKIQNVSSGSLKPNQAFDKNTSKK